MWYLFVALLLATILGVTYLMLKHAPLLIPVMALLVMVFHQQLWSLAIALHWMGWLW